MQVVNNVEWRQTTPYVYELGMCYRWFKIHLFGKHEAVNEQRKYVRFLAVLRSSGDGVHILRNWRRLKISAS